MNIRPHAKNSPSSPSSPKIAKKKLIIKSKKLTIDIPPSDPPVALNKNSPKHNNRPICKSVIESPLKTPEKSPKRTPSVTKSKFFLFPPEHKPVTRKISNVPSIKPAPKSGSPKPKTPMQKKKQPKLIKRPKTTSNNEKMQKIPESPSLKTLVTQVSAPTKPNHEEIYNEHLFQTFQGLKIVKSLPPVDLEQLKAKRLTVPRRPGFENRKTVVFDLDETLVHCCENIQQCHPDVILPVQFPSGEVISAGINIRPYTLECLKEMNKHFEVFVFTASHQCYANVVIDHLDPDGELIHQRFFRENCINMNGIFIKDLRIFGNRKLSETVIVDNASYSYAYQLDNGVPIISWHDNKDDKELLNLTDYLKTLVEVEDVREKNFETFHLRTFYDDYMKEYLIQQQ